MERQINIFYYERIVSTKDKEELQTKAKNNAKELAAQPQDFIKDPYVLEVLNIPANSKYLENDLEK